MSLVTIRRFIADALDDLTQNDFLKFCHQLRDRREGPRITRREVDGKSVLEVTDLLVSKFTEVKALPVTVETLRQIDCNEAAETLDLNTNACLDNGDPTFPKTLKGEVDTKASREALKYAADQQPLRSAKHGGPVKKPAEVEAEAKACVLSERGDPCNNRLVLSRFRIQFGKYKGQTFKWLLENDVGYTAYIVVSHQEERKHSQFQDPLMANKDSLAQYATAYPEVLKEVRGERAKQRSLQSDQAGKVLVGFGKYPMETLQSLYESEDPQKISYVDFLRTMKSTSDPGSRMDSAIKYILMRDRQAPRRRAYKRKWVQSTRGQQT